MCRWPWVESFSHLLAMIEGLFWRHEIWMFCLYYFLDKSKKLAPGSLLLIELIYLILCPKKKKTQSSWFNHVWSHKRSYMFYTQWDKPISQYNAKSVSQCRNYAMQLNKEWMSILCFQSYLKLQLFFYPHLVPNLNDFLFRLTQKGLNCGLKIQTHSFKSAVDNTDTDLKEFVWLIFVSVGAKSHIFSCDS